MGPYIADVDSLARLAARTGIVGEGIGRVRLGSGIATTESTTTAATTLVASTSSTTISTTATKASSETAASAEASATAKASATTETTSEAAATEAGLGACEAIFADFKVAALPVITVELRDSIACVFDGLESNDTRTLRTTIRCNVDVSAKNGASNSCEKIVSWGSSDWY